MPQVGSQKDIPATFATGSTFSTAINIGGWPRVAFSVPTFAVGTSTDSANVYVQVANTSTTSEFKDLKDMGVYSAASGIENFEVPRGIGNYTVICRPLRGFNWMRLYTAQGATFNATSTAGLSCTVHLLP